MAATTRSRSGRAGWRRDSRRARMHRRKSRRDAPAEKGDTDMRRFIVPSIAAGVAVVLTLLVTSMTSTAAGTSYADDRAAIEDLQARYLFAMDFGDPDLY